MSNCSLHFPSRDDRQLPKCSSLLPGTVGNVVNNSSWYHDYPQFCAKGFSKVWGNTTELKLGLIILCAVK